MVVVQLPEMCIRDSSDNGVQMVNRVGESPYQFYGYQADGVYSTQAEADAANLSNRTGRRYNAGDVRFVDQNGDNRIDDKDRILLGLSLIHIFSIAWQMYC